ncbi:hypothetical protein GRF29_77g2060137 [Pseudopithomyces chartarum]|uniref:EF-hand domain-containing protein n=1 Tax=Pseudopithomyces chartarum TaxID=1892770 RepID=A0AAN6LWA2_9PLEO|nr:hypothetical protein GRF29_77g2060137 [Pseudopithomyces chartarum]
MLSNGGRDSARIPRTSSARPDYNTAPPSSSRPDDRYGRAHSNSYGSYDSRPPPGAYGAPDPRYDDRPRYDAQPRRDDRTHDPRLDGMFDTDRSGSVNFEEFCGLWGFLSAWRDLFDRFDVDRSGTISYDEFSNALVAFGYRLSSPFVKLLYQTYDRRGNNSMSFDLFVQACISLKRMTDVFKKYDSDRDGYITLSFEEFLTGAQTLFLFNSISAETDTGLY